KERFFLYLVLRQGDCTWVRKRSASDIWQDLFEFPMLELERLPADAAEAGRHLAGAFPLPPELLRHGRLSAPYQQTLTHREVKAMFFEIHLPADQPVPLPPAAAGECQQAAWAELKKKFAFPRLISRYLQGKAVILTLF
ncbi:MAG TPA: NUDIX domain-containing protein, partial [Saprospiraceae bacterium]|nr:NUDIX domain-containing protein [Saprospiraceae bacterium]